MTKYSKTYKKPDKKSNNEEERFDWFTFPFIKTSFKRLMNFSLTKSIDNIKNNYNVFQKVLILGIILNFTYGFYYFYVNESFGDHHRVLESNEIPENRHLTNYTVVNQSDVIIGKPKTIDIYYSPIRDPKGKEWQSYEDSGITAQEILVLILISLILLFCIRIF